MNITYGTFDQLTDEQLKHIAKIDSEIPIELDPLYRWTPECAQERFDYFKKLEGLRLVVLNNDQIIGFHVLYLIDKAFAKISNISTFWIHPDFRQQGIGKKLKQMGEEWSRENNCDYIQTNVHRLNDRMIQINEDAGFQVTYLNMRKHLK